MRVIVADHWRIISIGMEVISMGSINIPMTMMTHDNCRMAIVVLVMYVIVMKVGKEVRQIALSELVPRVWPGPTSLSPYN